MTDEWSIDAILSLMGGTIFHFIVGIKIMWGNIAPYVTSYLVQFDPKVTYNSALHIYTGIFLGQSLTMYLGGRLEKKIGPRRTAYAGASFVSGCTYLSSYCTTLRSLVFLQGLVGVGIGLSYSAPILCGFGHLRHNKGVVSGVVTTGSGIGPFLSGLVATTFVNGENYPVDAATGLYNPNTSPVVGRVPEMFRILGMMYAIVGFVGASLLIPAKEGTIDDYNVARPPLTLSPGENDGEDATLLADGVGFDLYHDRSMMGKDDGGGEETSFRNSTTKSILRASNMNRERGHQRYGSRVKFEVRFELTTTQMINDSLSWLVIGAAICTGVSGFYLAATYKSYGQTFISDDHFITVVGCLGCLCNGGSRFIWGLISDRFGHFETLEITAYMYPIVMLIYTLSTNSKLAFGLCVCTMYTLWGASGCLMPAIVAFLFGDKHLGTNYGFIFLVFGVMCVIIIDSAGNSGLDFGRLNYFFISVSFVGALLCSHIRYLTSKVKDEQVLKHHRSTSSVHSML